MKEVITTQTTRIPIKLWLDNPEFDALKQAYNLAKLPFAFQHVVALPDFHLGYGMPIGSVLATKNVIIPHAVGNDISCLDYKTEILTKQGWKYICDWNDEEILQYDKDNDKATFIKPINYIITDCDSFYHLTNNYGLDQKVSEDHKILYWHGYRGRGYNLQNHIAKDFVKKHSSLKKGLQGGIKTTFNYEANTKIHLDENQIRVMAVVSADGCIRRRATVEDKVEVHLSKKRKIKRLKILLDNANITYTIYNHKDKTVTYAFTPPIPTKDLSFFWKANNEQLKILAEESLHWDGHIGDHKYYSTTSKINADIIQFAFAVSGVRCGIYSPKISDGRKKAYNVYLTQNTIVNVPNKEIKKVKSEDGKKYCFTVPSGYFVIRRNNKISITGNCGVASMKTNLTDIEEKDLKNIMSRIRKRVPVGMKRHKEKQEITLMPNMNDFNISFNFDEYIVNKEYNSALYQLGTLGSGNHFLELQKGSDGYIYVMIHSGSRNLGFKVAKEYNDIAKKLNEKWFSQVPSEWQLAFLPFDSEEGQQYFTEMRYCMAFAKANRKLMIENVKESITEVLHYADFFDVIDVNHNYASLENHFGKNVVVHRKGATQAKKGQIGLIPGSQGTSSYIVEGLGNKESFESCSHGAGRKMGRKQAQKNLNLEDEKKKLDDKGIIHSIRNTKDLDEASGAYKDIDEVMENQKDLVKVITELKPLAVIKG